MAKIATALGRRAGLGLLLSIGLVTAVSAAAADLRIRVTDAGGRPLANAAITADWPGAARSSGADNIAQVTQRHLKFHPHLLIVPVGTSVFFPNHDRTRHQVYSVSKAKTFNIKRYVGRPQRPIVFDRTGVVTLGCDIHDFMQAFIVVTDKPRWAVTDDRGRAIVRGLPAGRVEVSVWHPWMASENTRVARTLDSRAKTATIRLDVAPPPPPLHAGKPSLQTLFDRIAK